MKKENWLDMTYEKFNRVIETYDVSLTDLAEFSGNGKSWMIKFANRAYRNPTITRVQALSDALDDILTGEK